LRKSEIEKEKHLEKVVERNPIWGEKGRSENLKCIDNRRESGRAHQEMSHSARYSTPTTQASTDQYISHRSISSSDAGRWERVLNEA
jgi:hypothetical protein